LAQETAEELYQAGLYQEEVQGNLERAIDLFGRILVRFPNSRAVGAKAQLHIGLCYEKLGQQEAQQAYRRVIADFPDHTAEVAVARGRLAEIQRSADELNHQPTFRKVEIASKPQNGVLSPDGTKLAFVSEGSVWVVPLQGDAGPGIAGVPIRIGTAERVWAAHSQSAWSADGEWIAVNRGTTEAAYVFPAEGGDPRLVPIPDRGRHAWNYRLSLSPDGGTLAFSALEEGQVEGPNDSEKRLIFTTPVDGGEPRRMVEMWGRMPAFSPDGKTIAFVTHRHPVDGGWDSDLWLVPSSGGSAVKVLTTDIGGLRGPVWSPDGQYIAAHYEPGYNNFSQELWIISVASDGMNRPVAKISLPRNSQDMLAGWTPDNLLGVFIRTAATPSATFTVSATGGKAAQVTAEVELAYLEWSADGERILGSWWNPGDSAVTIGSVPAGGGELTGLPLSWGREVTAGGVVDVSPDGRRIVFMGVAGAPRFARPGPENVNIWTASMDGRDLTQLTGGSRFDTHPTWSPDGRWIAFLRLLEEDPDVADILLMPSTGGEIRQVSSDSDAVAVGGIAFSPDGDRIAYFSDSAIKAIPVGGGPSEVLLEVSDLRYFPNLSWSPDGSQIAYIPAEGGEIRVGSLDTGRSVPLVTGLSPEPRYSSVAWSPDGQRIAFGASWPQEDEFWLIGDFLPKGDGR
jgi:Tol biopolymer transport system component